MASIYDFLPPGTREQAGYAGLGALAQALLQGGAPTTTPGAGISALGAGFGGFGQAYNSRLNSGLQQAGLGMQMADAKRKQEQDELRRQAEARLAARIGGAPNMAANPQLASAGGTPSMGPPNVAGLMADPAAFQDIVAAYGLPQAMQMMQREDKETVVSPGATVLRGGRPIFTAPEKAPAPTEFEKALQAAGYQPGSPQYQKAAQDYVARKGLPMQVTNQVDLRQENEEAKVVGKQFGEMYSNLQNADMQAPGRIAKLTKLDSLLDQVNTGKFAGTMLEMKRAAKAAGMDLEAMGVRDDVAPAQAAVALSREMALELRNPQGGAGMPGAMSDKDREFLESMIPGIEMDPAGRKLIVEARKRLIGREREVAKMARNYRRTHGSLNEGFFEELAAHSEKNPLFADMPKPTAPAGGGGLAVGTVDSGYRFKGGNPADRNSWEKVN
jgi:hypothetical protein